MIDIHALPNQLPACIQVEVPVASRSASLYVEYIAHIGEEAAAYSSNSRRWVSGLQSVTPISTSDRRQRLLKIEKNEVIGVYLLTTLGVAFGILLHVCSDVYYVVFYFTSFFTIEIHYFLYTNKNLAVTILMIVISLRFRHVVVTLYSPTSSQEGPRH